MRCFAQRVVTKDSYWSWVVCFTATFSSTLMFGFALSFGVYQPYLMEYFGENKERTSWIGSIVIGLILFSGTFAVFLTDRFGHRTVNMACGFVCSVSVMASSFVNNLTLLYLSFGVLYGFAGGIILNVGYTMIHMYFKDYWPVAIGIVSSGSVTGMLMVTQFSEYLIELLGWRHSFRIMSGIIIFVPIVSLTYYPMPTQKEKIDFDPDNDKIDDQGNTECLIDGQTHPSQNTEAISITKHKNMPASYKEQNEIEKEENKSGSDREQNETDEAKETNDDTKEIDQETLLLEQPTINMPASYKEQNEIEKEEYKSGSDREKNETDEAKETNDDTKEIDQEKLLLEQPNSIAFSGGEGNDCDGDVDHENQKKTLHKQHRKMTFKDIFYLIKNVHFVFGLLSAALVYFGLYSPHIHLMQFALDLGISHRKSAQLYIYFAIVNIISRIVSGHVASKVKLSPLVLMLFAEATCGLSVLFLSLAKTYAHLVGFCIAYGTGNGCFITFQVLFFMSVVEPVQSGLSLGVAYLVGSIAVISGPPFAGYLADSTGSYVTSFFVIGSIMVFASLIPCGIHIKKLFSKCLR